ncbi:MAG: Asp-tRNA(Asn)/Glu-tRNA(Gln) amidotransferase subunit GatA [Verrucomicrobiales bacterium]
MNLAALSVVELRKKLAAREVSAVEAVQAVAEAARARDPEIGAYLSIDLDAALRAAETADVSLPLGGVPIAIKDAICVAGERCTCASKILHGYVSPYDATAIARLRAAGAIPLGRMNMDEFAMGSSTENSGFQVTRNPRDPSRTPGGSSGGSAAAVAADTAFAALGSDTGGSIRQPASFCGVVGLKPGYGRVSRYGLVAFASSLEGIGPLTKTVPDAAMLLQHMAGVDPLDTTSIDAPVPDYLSDVDRGVKGLRFGLPREYFTDGIAPGVRAAVDAAIEKLAGLGAELVEISLPHTEFAVATYYITATAEASSNLARFDGIRYGHRARNPADLTDLYARTRNEGFGAEVKRRIILGTYVLSSGYYDAFYLKAQKVRTLIRRDFTQAFENVDLIASPVTPDVAWKLGEMTNDPLKMYLADIFTIAANLAGICGISVPCGQSEGMPVGFQLMGKPLDEALILRAARAVEA